MQQTGSNRFGPTATAPVIKNLLLVTGMIGLFAAFLAIFWPRPFGFLGMQELFSLSNYGLYHIFIWQPVSYLFVQDIYGGVTFFFFLRFLFFLYLLWVIGSAIVEHIGSKRFLRFYLGTGILVALLTWTVMALTDFPLAISGSMPMIYALLTLWCLFNPELELLLFMTFPVKIKWLTLGFLTLLILVNLAQFDWTNITAYLSSAIIAYIYGVAFCSLQSPFQVTHRFDYKLTKLGRRFSARWEQKQKIRDEIYPNAKIFDIKTGKAILDDDEFMDAMLAKVSQKGEKGLSWREKRRMHRIAKRKRQEF